MRFSSDERGDTLIEVLIAVTVLSIVLISLYGLLNDAFRLSLQARERTQATNYLQQQSEGLRAMRDTMDWDEFGNAIDSVSDPFHVAPQTTAGTTEWAAQSGPATYDSIYNVSISEVATPGSTNRREFMITVNWDRFGGGADTTTAEFTLSQLEFDEFPVGTDPPPPGSVPPPPGTGVCGYYYSDQTDNLGSAPDFNFEGTPIVRHDEQIDYYWGSSAPMAGVSGNLFSVRWVGEIDIPQDGEYDFTTQSDDGVRLTIDGVDVIDEWYPHGPQFDSEEIDLTAGKHSLVMELYERTGQAVGELYWESSDAGIPYQLVPKTALFPDPSNTSCDSPNFQFHMIGAGAFDVGNDDRPRRGSEAGARLQSNESSDNMMILAWGSGYDATQPGINLNNRSGHMSWTGETIAFNQLRIRARGSEYNGWPNMRVYIDGNIVYNQTVNTTSYNVFTRNVGTRSAGQHTIMVQFTNDANGGSGQDRNLFVDYVELRRP